MAKAADAGHDFRQHVDALLAGVDDAQLAAALAEEPAGAVVRAIVEATQCQEPAPAARLKLTAYRLCKALRAQSATDDVVARNLLNIVTGSLGATGKLFLDGFEAFRSEHAAPHGGLSLPPGTLQEKGKPLALHSAYERVILDALAKLRRGGPDSLYREFTGKGDALPALRRLEQGLRPGDTVVVWLGGMLGLDANERRPNVHDYVFGAGFRSCPGMAMGKAIINGMLLALFEQPDLRALAGEAPNVTFAFRGEPPQLKP
jgi:hypothetical protein